MSLVDALNFIINYALDLQMCQYHMKTLLVTLTTSVYPPALVHPVPVLVHPVLREYLLPVVCTTVLDNHNKVVTVEFESISSVTVGTCDCKL